ncbi:MAG TPA: CsbD family protein [Burkholderiaceae bacterium]
MNKDQVKGISKDLEGKAQESAGQITGSAEQQIKGMGKQVAGKVQKGVGDVKEAVRDMSRDLRDDR